MTKNLKEWVSIEYQGYVWIRAEDLSYNLWKFAATTSNEDFRRFATTLAEDVDRVMELGK